MMSRMLPFILPICLRTYLWGLSADAYPNPHLTPSRGATAPQSSYVAYSWQFVLSQTACDVLETGVCSHALRSNGSTERNNGKTTAPEGNNKRMSQFLCISFSRDRDTLGHLGTPLGTHCPNLFTLCFPHGTRHTPFGFYNIKRVEGGSGLGTAWGLSIVCQLVGQKGMEKKQQKERLTKQRTQHTRQPSTCAGKLSNVTPATRK